MATDKQYMLFMMEQLCGLEEFACRPMMGEYILYYRGKIFGGLYDDRLLVKPVAAAKALMPNAPLELPYEGAKPLLMVEDVDDRDFLVQLVEAMYPELPPPEKKKG